MSSPKLAEFDGPQSKIDLQVGDIMQFRYQISSDGLIIGLASNDLDINESGARYSPCVVVDLLRPVSDRVRICTLTPNLLHEIGHLGSDLAEEEKFFLPAEPSSTTPADNGKTARTLSLRNPKTFFASDRFADINHSYQVSLTWLKIPDRKIWDFCRFSKDSIDPLLGAIRQAQVHYVDEPTSAREEKEPGSTTGSTTGSKTRRESRSETRSETGSETGSETREVPQPSKPAPPKASQTLVLSPSRKRTRHIAEV